MTPQDHWSAPDLTGTVAVVTGANWGAGRGVARVLGECGATVYVTGRSRAGRRSEAAGEDLSLAETAHDPALPTRQLAQLAAPVACVRRLTFTPLLLRDADWRGVFSDAYLAHARSQIRTGRSPMWPAATSLKRLNRSPERLDT